jgi:hypothetical protein
VQPALWQKRPALRLARRKGEKIRGALKSCKKSCLSLQKPNSNLEGSGTFATRNEPKQDPFTMATE